MSADVGKSDSTDRGEPETFHTAGAKIGQSRLSRRGFMRAATVGGAAAVAGTAGEVAVGSHSDSGTARAAPPLVPIGIAAGGVAVGYLAKKGVDAYVGDNRDYSSYTGEEALMAEIVTGAVEMNSADERVMTSIENNIANSDNVALSKGKAAVIEEMNDEKPVDVAQNAMQDAIDDYYATIQENLINHYNQQAQQVYHHLEQVDAHEELEIDPDGGEKIGYLRAEDHDPESVEGSDRFTFGAFESVVDEVEFVNGDTATVTALKDKDSDRVIFPSWWQENLGAFENETKIRHGAWVKDFEGNETEYFNVPRFGVIMEDLLERRDSVNAELSGFVTDVYDYYEPGEIPTEDLVDPITASTELRQDYDGFQAQGAHAAMLGIPTSAEQSVHITLEDDSTDVWADIYTNHVPEDSDGDPIGFEAGETYYPTDWSDPLYIAYEYVDEYGEEHSDFVQIEQKFTINTIEDADGETVDSFQTEDRNNQTSDVEELEDELMQLREEQIRLQEEAQDDGGIGGGGIDLGGWFSGIGQSAAALGAGVLALIFGAIALGGE